MDKYKRKLDDLGRVVLPRELLNGINAKPGELVDVTCEGGSIRIDKSVSTCWLCGSDENLVDVEIGEQNCLICGMCVMRVQMSVIRRQRELEEAFGLGDNPAPGAAEETAE